MSDGAALVLGIDHVYITVRDLARSERFYDSLLVDALGHVKKTSPIGGDPHVHYINRHFSLALRPARAAVPHDPYAAGLHHFCLRVDDEAAVDRVVQSSPPPGSLRARRGSTPSTRRIITPRSSATRTECASR